MNADIQKRIDEWLSPDYDEATRKEIQSLIDSKNEAELADRFFQDLEFGTGGLRGVLGAGANRMNSYNVRKATQGLANTIIKKGLAAQGVVVSRDSRNFSLEFARDAAGVLAANGIKVYFFEDIHPTPLASYAVRETGSVAGVMITASHNPKEYNGYKVFWSDGGQVISPADKEIIAEVRSIASMKQVKFMEFAELQKSPLFSVIDAKIDPTYLGRVKELSLHPEVIVSSGVKICYSPLHGTGYKLVPASLRNFGFSDVVLVEAQSKPDGNFPTAAYPNPEEKEAMSMGMAYAQEKNADVFLATDPDADRIGVSLRKKDGSYALLNGNQIATLLLYYVLSETKNLGKMPKNPRAVTTIVTTGLLLEIAAHFGVKAEEVLTGFKWIGAKIKGYETTGENFLFGCEESHGYLAGTFVRDKDAVIASSLFAELVAFYKSKGVSAYDLLEEIYLQFGYYRESQKSFTMKGQDGAAEIKQLMESLRKNPPLRFGKYTVLETVDLKTGEVTDRVKNAPAGKWDLPASDVVVFNLSDKAKVIARPSGTEPKIKFYFTTSGKPSAGENLDALRARVDGEHEALKADFVKAIGL